MTNDSLEASPDASPRKHSHVSQYVAALTATLGAFALGNVIAWSSVTQTSVTKGFYDFPVSEDEFSWIGSLVALGAAASTIPTGLLLDFIGRKNTMLLITLPFAAGWAVINWPVNVTMLYAGRFITGFCGGLFSVASPLYIGEIAEPQIRGRLGTCFQLMVVVGIEFTYIVGRFTDVFVISIISMTVPLIFALIFVWMPETPQYHIKRNNMPAAYVSLEWFRGGKHTEYNVSAELDDMEKSLNSSVRVPFLQSFKTKAAKRAILISMGLMFFQQLSGINAVIFYTVAIFDASGGLIDSNSSTMIVGAVLVVFTVIAALIMEKVNRKILMLLSLDTMLDCTVAIALSMYYMQNEKSGYYTNLISWIPLVCLCIYVAAFSMGAGPVPWLYLGEVFPTEIKSTASSLSAMFNWLLAFLVTRLYPRVNEAIGPLSFLIFTAFLTIGYIFVWFLMLETRGKTLEEIQHDLSS